MSHKRTSRHWPCINICSMLSPSRPSSITTPIYAWSNDLQTVKKGLATSHMYSLGSKDFSRDPGEIPPQSTSYALLRAGRSRRTDHRQSCQTPRRESRVQPVVHL